VLLAAVASNDAYYDIPEDDLPSTSGFGPMSWTRKGLRRLGMIHNHTTDAHCLIAEITNQSTERKEIKGWNARTGDLLLAFRGTGSWTNVVSDLQFSRHPLPFDFLLPRSVSTNGMGGSQTRFRRSYNEVRAKNDGEGDAGQRWKNKKRWVSEPSANPEVDAKVNIETVKANWMMRPMTWASSFFTGLTGTGEEEKPIKNSKSINNLLNDGGESYNALRIGDNGDKSPVKFQGGHNDIKLPPLHNDIKNEEEKCRRGGGNHTNLNSRTKHRLESTEDLASTGVLDWLTRERAHSGFLRLYLSVRNSLFATLDPLLTSDAPATSARRQKDWKRKASRGFRRGTEEKRKVSMSMREPLHFRPRASMESGQRFL